MRSAGKLFSVFALTAALTVGGSGVGNAAPVACETEPTGSQCFVEAVTVCSETYSIDTQTVEWGLCVKDAASTLCYAGTLCREVQLIVRDACDDSAECTTVLDLLIDVLRDLPAVGPTLASLLDP